MDDRDLKVLINSELRTATSAHDDETQLSAQLEKSLSFYLGERFGNEIEDRSQVILTTVRDTIEWMMPQFMAVFCGSNQVCRFDADSPEDEKQAELETDVVNHVFYKENDGFNVLYMMIKDALMQKNGIVKVYYEETEIETREAYEDQTDYEFMMLLNEEDLEIIEHTEKVIGDELSNNIVRLHDGTFIRRKIDGGVRVVNIPPEEFLISDQANSIFPKHSPFCAHRVVKTRSDLVSEGYDRKKIDNIASSTYDGDNQVSLIRDYLDENTEYYPDAGIKDKSMEQIELYECVLQVDYDDDGIAEWRKVTLAGNEILENEEIDYNPFAAICPNMLPHKFHGLSVADDTMDLQLIESIIMRQCLDNMYSANNQRKVVNANVNLDDLLTSRPDGVIRTTGIPSQDVMPLVPMNIVGDGLQMIDYLDMVKEQRTGVGKTMQGQNQEVANDTAHGLERIMSAAEKKIELICRVFAETGIKEIFIMIRGLMQKHGQVSDFFLGGEVVNVNPQEWKDRKNITVKVGLGTGDQLKMQAAMGRVLELQEKVMAAGGNGILIDPKKIYNAIDDFAKFSGLPGADHYFIDPETVSPQPPHTPPPDPQMEAIKAQQQIEMAKLMQKSEKDKADLMLKMEQEKTKAQQENMKLEQNMLKMQQDVLKFMTELELKYKTDVPGSVV